MPMSRHLSGIGGVFIFSEQPGPLAQWYARVFDLDFQQVGEQGSYHVFWSRADQDPDRRLDTTFAVMPSSGSLPRPPRNRDPGNMYGDQPYMVNLRVEDMDQMLAHLLQQLGIFGKTLHQDETGAIEHCFYIIKTHLGIKVLTRQGLDIRLTIGKQTIHQRF